MLSIFFLIILFITSDYIMEQLNIKGSYYINHFICNMMIVYNTYECMLYSYSDMNICDFNNILLSQNSIYALHLYHMIWYFDKLRFDDWIHHLIMVGISLPLTSLVDKYNLIGHGMFFINGLPGGIDYILLALVRNNMVDKEIEKRINKYINLWIRCPGCISNVTLSFKVFIDMYNTSTFLSNISSIIIMLSIYWNGIYFMEQVVSDHRMYTLQYKKK